MLDQLVVLRWVVKHGREQKLNLLLLLAIQPKATEVATDCLNNNVFIIDDEGKVGINLGKNSNTALPQSTLDVSGNIHVNTEAFQNELGYFQDGSGATVPASTAIGFDTLASAQYSIAMGEITTASGVASTAMGRETTAFRQLFHGDGLPDRCFRRLFHGDGLGYKCKRRRFHLDG